jgi:hypothetical protein
MWACLSHLVDVVAYFDDLVVKVVAHLHGQSVDFFEESRWLDVGNIGLNVDHVRQVDSGQVDIGQFGQCRHVHVRQFTGFGAFVGFS